MKDALLIGGNIMLAIAIVATVLLMLGAMFVLPIYWVCSSIASGNWNIYSLVSLWWIGVMCGGGGSSGSKK